MNPTSPRRERHHPFPTGLLLLALASVASRAAPVPNPSFEDNAGRDPAGWTFGGKAEARAEAWTTNQAFAGERALRLDARHGSVRWDAAAFSARAGQAYLLQWQTRFAGEKSWRFRADFCGVEISFRDADGRELGMVRQSTSCWQTPGWRPGWFHFTTPRRTATVTLRFAIETAAPLPGGFEVDALALEEWPPAATPDDTNSCALALKIVDEQGRPVGARVRIANSRGEPVLPPGAIAYERADGAFHPLEAGACHAVVPRGSYTLTVTRGFEYEPWEQSIAITKPGRTLTVRLRRPWDWRRRGWFSVDHHTHLFRHGGSLFPMLSWPDALRAARCEGLDFLPFMGADRYPKENLALTGKTTRRDFAYELTDEITEDFWGHVCPIGVSAVARRDPRYDAGPMNLDRYAAFADSGGVFSYGHPHGPLGDGDDLEAVAKPGMGHVAREFPIDLALGMPCAIDLLAMEGARNQLDRKLRDLYRLWNLGFRPAVAASTDFHIDQGRQPIGAVRTYVQSGRLDPAAIAQAYRAGRTFATSGPLLDLRVAGTGPGGEVRLAKANRRLRVQLEAVSIGKLDRVELLVNGEVFRTFTATKPHRIAAVCEVPAARSLWLAARAYGPADRHLASELEGRPLGAGQFAHTSPVYVLVGGQPIRAAQRADAEYFIRWCDAVLAGWRMHVNRNPDQGRYERIVAERLARAREVFAGLATDRR